VPGEGSHGSPFFLSYARTTDAILESAPGYDPDQQVERFFRDLYVNISQLIYLPVGVDPGFMDRRMRGGINWTGELLQALGHCQILVPLLSPAYLNSEWCGMEFHAFSQRTPRPHSEDSSAHQDCIIPVIWIPLQRQTLPPQITADIIFSPETPDVAREYRADGIFGILRQHQETTYDIIVWQLAKYIARVYNSHHLEPRDYKPEDLRNVFEGDSDG
jgi:TIR domain